jgi:hypothetical protein
VKPAHIDHRVLEFSSVLKFVEKRFRLAPLTARDEQANDLARAFDFDQDPIDPLILSTRSCGQAAAEIQLDPQYHGAGAER